MRTWLDWLIVAIVLTVGSLLGGVWGFIIAVVFIMASFRKPLSPSTNVLPDTEPRHILKVPPQYYAQYSAYLRSDEWKALRKVVLKRDRYTCVDCLNHGLKLQVHHIHYDGIETMTFTPDQLVSVCHRCHDIRHGRHLWNS